MAKLSNRISNLENAGDDGWGVYYRARKMQAGGRKLTMLCVGDHDTPTASSVLDRMAASAKAGNTGYAAVLGMPSLRKKIADFTTDQIGTATTADNVAVTSGGQAALFAAITACIDPGDTLVAIDPYYATYPSTTRAAGGVFKTVPARAENGFQPIYTDLAKATKGAKALLINTPNNPTGAVYSAETLDAIERVCVENDLWLISDEVYATQVFDGVHISPRSRAGLQDRTLIIGSFSKSHIMTGFRIGWLVAPDTVIAACLSLSNATTYGSPGFIQDAAEHALDSGGHEAACALYKTRRDIAVAALEGHKRLRISPPQGAMYVMIDVRGTGMTGEEFAYGLLDDAGIVVMPGESFGTAAAGHIRVALTVPDDDLRAALVRLAQFADEKAKI